MTRTIVAVYESLYAANQAVQDLSDIGFSDELIDIMPRRRTKPADELLIPITGAPSKKAGPVDAPTGVGEPLADFAASINSIDSAASAEARLMNKNRSKKDLRSEINFSGQSLGMWIGLGVGCAMGLTGAIFNALGMLYLPLPVLQVNASLIGWVNALMVGGAGALLGVISGGAIGGLLGVNITEEEARAYARNVREGDVVVTILADWDSIDPAMQIVQKHGPLEVREHSINQRVTGYLIAASQPVFFNPRRFNSRNNDEEHR